MRKLSISKGLADTIQRIRQSNLDAATPGEDEDRAFRKLERYAEVRDRWNRRVVPDKKVVTPKPPSWKVPAIVGGVALTGLGAYGLYRHVHNKERSTQKISAMAFLDELQKISSSTYSSVLQETPWF
jgi:hypothetical protein